MRPTPGIYVGTEEAEDDVILFEDKMEALNTQLQAPLTKRVTRTNFENFNKL
jgi:hypothetical protein